MANAFQIAREAFSAKTKKTNAVNLLPDILGDSPVYQKHLRTYQQRREQTYPESIVAIPMDHVILSTSVLVDNIKHVFGEVDKAEERAAELRSSAATMNVIDDESRQSQRRQTIREELEKLRSLRRTAEGISRDYEILDLVKYEAFHNKEMVEDLLEERGGYDAAHTLTRQCNWVLSQFSPAGIKYRLNGMFKGLTKCERMIVTSPITTTDDLVSDLPEPPATEESADPTTLELLSTLGTYDRELARIGHLRAPLTDSISSYIGRFRSYCSALKGSAGRTWAVAQDTTDLREGMSDDASRISNLIPSIEPINRRTHALRDRLLRIEDCAHAFQNRLTSFSTTQPECSRLLEYVFETSRNMDEMSHPLKALDKAISELVALEPELVMDISMVEHVLEIEEMPHDRVNQHPANANSPTPSLRDYWRMSGVDSRHHSNWRQIYRRQIRGNIILLDAIRKMSGSYPPSQI